MNYTKTGPSCVPRGTEDRHPELGEGDARTMGLRGLGALACVAWLATALGCGPRAAEVDAGLDSASASLDGGAGDAGEYTDASVLPVCEGEVTRRFDPAECPERRLVGALDEERGMWVATRLTLPAGTRRISNLGYALQPKGDEGDVARCNNGFAHRIQVFSAPTGEGPPAIPDLLTDMIDVPSTSPTGSIRPFLQRLAAPVDVPEGHDVFVAVEMVRTAEIVCLITCATEGFGSDTFWSNAVNPPYAWAPMDSFGADFHVELALCVGSD
ncbi:MAG: hypothetical protein KF729_22755 [Sandaracinaceae bacterium]|nr:hypothetical protein [Sandaracinaceae bacterium]